MVFEAEHEAPLSLAQPSEGSFLFLSAGFYDLLMQLEDDCMKILWRNSMNPWNAGKFSFHGMRFSVSTKRSAFSAFAGKVLISIQFQLPKSHPEPDWTFSSSANPEKWDCQLNGQFILLCEGIIKKELKLKHTKHNMLNWMKHNA